MPNPIYRVSFKSLNNILVMEDFETYFDAKMFVQTLLENGIAPVTMEYIEN